MLIETLCRSLFDAVRAHLCTYLRWWASRRSVILCSFICYHRFSPGAVISARLFRSTVNSHRYSTFSTSQFRQAASQTFLYVFGKAYRFECFSICFLIVYVYLPYLKTSSNVSRLLSLRISPPFSFFFLFHPLSRTLADNVSYRCLCK